MATLVIEDGTIVEDANSYVDLEEADEYFENNSTWNALTDAEKTDRLFFAAIYIENLYRFIGSISDQTQNMRWPRVGVVVDGYEIEDNIIPKNIKYAQMEAANIENLYSNFTSNEISSISAGSVSISYFDPSLKKFPKYNVIENLLQNYVITPGFNISKTDR